jgi:uncharacterized alkaline shock family protein YloU
MKTEVLIENWDSIEVTEVFYIKNTGDKLSRQLLSLVDSSKGNNYYDDGIRVAILSNDCIRVSTYCINDYGRSISNENYTNVAKSDIPYFTAKKLGLI